MNYQDIKFRAWHKEQKKMYVVSALDITNELVVLRSYDGFEKDTVLARCDEVELMMYTGQQDKCGVEIYEGDVVSTVVKEDYTTQTETREIEIYIATSIDTETYGGPDMSVVYTKVEIIGNKYENPDLI